METNYFNSLMALVFVGFLLIGPAVLFLIIGIILMKRKNTKAKIFFILAGIYVLISGGICGVLLSSLNY